MDGDAPMSLLGPSAINSRIAELQSRIDAMTPRESASRGTTARETSAPSFKSQLEGAIGQPVDPFHPSVPGVGGDLQGMIGAAAERNGVSSDVLAALVHQESGGNPQAVSRCGAQGLCQLMPDTARSVGVENPFDPAQSLDGGARYLRRMLDQNDGDLPRALASYNAGPGRIKGRGFAEWPQESRHYVTSIMARLRNG